MHRECGWSPVKMLSAEIVEERIDLSCVVHRTAGCLAQLTQTIISVEHQVLSGNRPADPSLTEANALQALDFLKQATEDIAAMLARLGDAAPQPSEINAIDVLAPMKLQKLRDAIEGKGGGPKPDYIFTTNEEVELF